MTNTTDNTVAQIILAQLGGNRFIAMTGAKSMTYDERSLNMRVGRNAKGVTHIRVTLRDDDTYSFLAMRVHGHKVTEKARLDGIYADQLVETFERETGLYTSL